MKEMLSHFFIAVFLMIGPNEPSNNRRPRKLWNILSKVQRSPVGYSWGHSVGMRQQSREDRQRLLSSPYRSHCTEPGVEWLNRPPLLLFRLRISWTIHQMKGHNTPLQTCNQFIFPTGTQGSLSQGSRLRGESGECAQSPRWCESQCENGQVFWLSDSSSDTTVFSLH